MTPERPQATVKTLPGRGAAYWKKQVERSVAKRRDYETWWEANLRAYAPRVHQDPDKYGADVNTNRDFTLTERKKSDLFYQRPDVTLTPTPLMEGPIPGVQAPATQPGQQPQPVAQSVAIGAHEQIVNEKLGDDGVDAVDLMDAVLFDVLCTQGVGFTMLGYESVTVDVQQPDPRWQPNPLLPIELQQPPMVTVPVPVHEHCFWEHFSGKQAIIPPEFRSTSWDKAPYLGHQFTLPLTPGNRRKYKLPDDFTGKKSDPQQYYDHGGAHDGGDDVFTGVELWYRSALYREDIRHPEHLTHLVLVDGIDEPVIHQDCPYQTLDAKGGLTPDSLIGFPIHPFSVRKLTDSAYVPSDSTMIRPLVNELNVYREQQVQFRDAATLKWMYNTDALPMDAVQKIVRAPIGGMIGVPAEAFHGEGAIKELPQGTMPRESFAGQQAIDDDIARTSAIDAAGAGVQSQANQTATEAQIQQGNANARLDKERGIILKRYIKGVTKFSTLLQRYLPVEQAAQIVGPQLAQYWDAWRKTVPSALAFTAMPDSALRVDQAIDRKQAQDLYTYLAQDPHVNRKALLTKLLRKFHVNPDDVLTDPPPSKPEPPKLAFSFKGEDFIGPQAPIVLGIAEQLGLTIDPSWVQTSQAMLQQSLALAAQAEARDAEQQASLKHGGKVAQMESLDKHATQQTGGMQNTGAAAALGAGGGFLQ